MQPYAPGLDPGELGGVGEGKSDCPAVKQRKCKRDGRRRGVSGGTAPSPPLVSFTFFAIINAPLPTPLQSAHYSECV